MRFTPVLFLFLLAASAWAESADDARKELSSTLTAIKESGARQKALAGKALRLRTELKALQEEMVRMGKSATEEEEDLSLNEQKLADLEQQKKNKTQTLLARQGELSSVISAMVKLGELPPEAVIAMPGKLDETLATARALGLFTHAIEDEAQRLKVQLRELSALEDKIRQGRETVAVRRTSLTAKQAELAGKVKERSALFEQAGGQEREERERVARLTSKSKSLQELVDSLARSEYGWKTGGHEEKPPAKPESQMVKRHDKPGGRALRSFEEAEGHIRMPAAGRIVSRYGNTSAGETFSKGIMIETRRQAGVVAPYDGEVVFAGAFRDYGRIVIIRHSDDYHTLLSGMDEIDCKPGQYLLEGEPIGGMGASTRLYMELREDGKPVDPAGWVKS